VIEGSGAESASGALHRTIRSGSGTAQIPTDPVPQHCIEHALKFQRHERPRGEEGREEGGGAGRRGGEADWPGHDVQSCAGSTHTQESAYRPSSRGQGKPTAFDIMMCRMLRFELRRAELRIRDPVPF
jgi:hypothetical protein